MPYAFDPPDELANAVQQIALTSSDADYIDHLVPVMRDIRRADRATKLVQALDRLSASREAEIEKMCNSNHQEFVSSVNALLRVREGTMQLTSEILSLNEGIQTTTEKLAGQKKALVESRGVRQNIDEANRALEACLEVLRLANQVHDLLAKKKYYAALKAQDELQNVHLRDVSRYKIAELIQQSVPATQRMIADAVKADLNTWLYRIREASQYLGEVAFFQTETRRARHADRTQADPSFANYKINSAIELIADETDDFDPLHNEETETDVDFSPLLECIHIHETLGQLDRFRAEYAATRRTQRDLSIPDAVNLLEEEDADLSSLLESIAGFSILEKAISSKAGNSFRPQAEVDELYHSMCQSAITLITKALPTVNDDEKLLRIKGRIALFMQTMQTWGYTTSVFNALLMQIFDKYSQLLKKRFSDDFQEIVSTDDYMPMPINTLEEYDKVVDVSWYTPAVPREELQFPCVLPFSQMYPLCCIDIRNFLNQIYLFSDDHFQRSAVIDSTLQSALDELLVQKVCQSLVERLSVNYPGQVVQILTNLGHFETACIELQKLLMEARSSKGGSGAVVLAATEKFREGKKRAEKRIFELVNGKIDDLVEIAEYDWTAAAPLPQPSEYMQELTQYLSVNIESVLLGLPTEIKELVYFDALSHAANKILALPLDPIVKKLSPAAVHTLSNDVEHLSEFVQSLDNPILDENLDELRQTVALMASENPDEFFDVSTRNKKFGKVDNMNGAVLLEKVQLGAGAASNAVISPTGSGASAAAKSAADKFATISSRFGINRPS